MPVAWQRGQKILGCYSRTFVACRPYYTTGEAIETPFTYHFAVV